MPALVADWRAAAPPAGRLLLAGALVFTGLIGGSEAGHFLVVVRAASALIGAALIAVYLLRAPARHDAIDLLVLGGLVAFLITCTTSSIPRLSFDAAVTSTAYAAAIYVARGAVADPRGRELAITVLGIMGALVAVGFLAAWGGAWGRWLSVAGAGLPPFDLALPSAPYRHYYLVGTMAGILLPATVLLARRRVVWPIGVVGVLSSLAVMFMCGSRTVWLAGVAAGVTTLVARGGIRLPRLRLLAASAVPLLLVLIFLATQLASRIGATSTIEGRLGIWSASIGRWLESPLFGFGPGTFASQLTLAGHDRLVIHGHNAAIQVLVEGGVLGLVALGLVGAAVLLGVSRAGPPKTAAGAAVTFFAVACLTDNPSAFAFLVIPTIVWTAILCPREALPTRHSSVWPRRSTLALAALVALASASTIAAAYVYDRIGDDAEHGDIAVVVRELRRAADLDPSHPLYQRDLGVWLTALGRAAEGSQHLQRSVELNPADMAAWRSAAIVAALRSRGDEAQQLAEQAVELRPNDAVNLLTVAYVAREADAEAQLRSALVRALSFEPWMAASSEWQTEFPGDIAGLLLAAHESWENDRDADSTNNMARSWLAGMIGAPVDPGEFSISQAAASLAIDCRIDEAEAYLAELSATERRSANGLLVQVLVAQVGHQPLDDLLTLAGLRWPILVFLVESSPDGSSPFVALADDVWTYGRRPIPVAPIGPILPTSESGLGTWLHDPVAAADAGAPQSGLAACR